MLKILKKQGMASLVEVIVTAVIFLIAAVGILMTVSMLKPHSVDSAHRLEATYLGKQILDSLRAQVDARMWDCSESPLAVGDHSNMIGDYTANWTVAEDPSTGVRTVDMEVFYTP